MKRSSIILLFVSTLFIGGAVFWLWKPWPQSPTPPLVPSTPTAQETSTPAPQLSTETSPDTLPAPPPDLAALREQADRDLAAVAALKAEHKLVEARDALHKFLTTHSKSERLPEAKALLGDLHMTLLFSKTKTPEKIEHKVVTGDSLAAIASKYNVPVALLQKSNGLTSSTIRSGDTLLLYPAKFSILVEKSKATLTLLDNGQFFKQYPVSVGAPATGTPMGDFLITARLAQPDWWREDGKKIPYGDPENVLGTHWLSLNIPHYGIHGTAEPDSIGKPVSKGCVRMHNRDVEELFTILPIKTPVRIVE